jgi:hypothetical protein
VKHRTLALAATVCLAGAACSSSSSAKDTSAPAPTTVTTTPRTTTTEAPQPDDVPAGNALVAAAQLPTGLWSGPATPVSALTVSANDLVATEQCAATAPAAARQETRTGHAREVIANSESGVQFVSEVELFPSPARARAAHDIVAGAQGAPCFEAVVKQHAADAGITLDDVRTSKADLGLNARALGVETIDGFEVTATASNDPIVARTVMMMIGGGVTTVTVIGRPDAANPIDLAALARAAAQGLRATFNLD